MRMTLPIAMALALPLMSGAAVAQIALPIEGELLEQVPVPVGADGAAPELEAPAPVISEAPEASGMANPGEALAAPAPIAADGTATMVDDATGRAAAAMPAPPPAPAAAEPMPMTADRIGSGLREHVELLRASAPVKAVTYADMSSNGEDQALVVFDNCDDIGCEWQLIAYKREGGFQSVGASWARDVSFEATAGGGAVVNADGVTWAYSGHWIYPYGSLLNHIQQVPGTQDMAEAIIEQTDFDQVTPADIETYNINLSEASEGMEKIHVIGGLHNSFGSSGHPFVITDAEGRVVEAALSVGPPLVFSRGEQGGATIVWDTPSGFQMVSFE